MLIQFDSVYVESTLVAIVRPTSGDHTVIFTAGQSAIDSGHLIDLPIEEVVSRLQQVQAHEFAAGLLEEIESDKEKSLLPYKSVLGT